MWAAGRAADWSHRISSFCLLGLEGPEDTSFCLDREGAVGIFVAGVGGVLSGG